MVLDRQEITNIFNETYPSLCRFLESLLGKTGAAEEVAQDSFLRLCHAEFAEVPAAEIRFWLFRVGRNLALDELRKTRTRAKFWNIAAEVFRVKLTSPEESYELSEMQKTMQHLLKLLPEHQRSALLLREQEEMSYREIAIVLSISEAKVKIDIYRARAALREEWQRQRLMKK